MLYRQAMTKDTPNTRPDLFDTHLLPSRRDRAMALGFVGRGDFIHELIAQQISDRVDEVLREFKDIAILGAGGGTLVRTIQAARPTSNVQAFELSALRAESERTTWVSSLDPMPLKPESYDLVISALELHWQNDPVGQLVQMRRALRPDGLMLAALFGGQTLAEMRACLAEAEIETTGGLSPRIAPMGELRDLGALVQRAGLTMPVADSERIDTSYAGPLQLMHDLRAMGETNILSGRRRQPMRRETLARCVDLYHQNFPAADGRIQATFEIVFLTGWAPGPDQPKPLRPGSAVTRLADALDSQEVSAGEKASFVMPTGKPQQDD